MGSWLLASLVAGILLSVTTQYLISRQHSPGGNSELTVITSSGRIRGQRAETRPHVSEFLGIPYAQPPVGDLRFAAPVRFISDQELNAFTYSDDCPQTPSRPVAYPNATEVMPEIVANFASQKGNPQSEDCLKLNVWSKDINVAKKPVLIWFHGGRFAGGSTNNLFYQGQYIAGREDVVVVTVNYRLNIFGFSGAPGLPQNVGLLDQRMAVEWVRDNIAAFGGDPDRITIFGHSAGGVAVDYYTYAWRKNPIVSGAISMAGTALSTTPNTAEESTKYWNTAVTALGCAGANDIVACVRSKPFPALSAAVLKVPPEPSKVLPQPVFHPTVDEKIVFSDYENISSQGSFTKVPLLIGHTNNEAGYYKIPAHAADRPLTPEQWTNFNLAGFTCASARAAEHRAQRDIPVWRYRYYGQWPNTILYPGSGAYHGTDVAQVFGTAADVSGAPCTDAENQVSALMMHAWAVFAANPASGLSELGWPRYSASGNTLVRLAYENSVHVTFVASESTDGGCATIGTDVSYARGAF